MPGTKLLILIIIGLTLSLPALAKERSSSIVISPDGELLAVVNNDSRSVTLVDESTGQKIKEIFVGRDPQTLAFDAPGQKMYVTNRLDEECFQRLGSWRAGLEVGSNPVRSPSGERPISRRRARLAGTFTSAYLGGGAGH